MAPALLPLNPSFGSPAPACAFQRPRCQKRPLLSLGIGPRSAPRRSFSSPAPASSLFPPAQTRLWSMEYPPGHQRPAMLFSVPLWGRERKNAREPEPVAVPSGALVRIAKRKPRPRAWPPAPISHPPALPPFPPADSCGTRESRTPPRPLPQSGILPQPARSLRPTPCGKAFTALFRPGPAAPLFPPARCARSSAETLRQRQEKAPRAAFQRLCSLQSQRQATAPLSGPFRLVPAVPSGGRRAPMRSGQSIASLPRRPAAPAPAGRTRAVFRLSSGCHRELFGTRRPTVAAVDPRRRTSTDVLRQT